MRVAVLALLLGSSLFPAASDCVDKCDRAAAECVDACEVEFKKDAPARVGCKVKCTEKHETCTEGCR